MIEHGPFAVMAGAPWNVLDSRGARIALCGGDSNADWEQCGPAIAAAIVEALNEMEAARKAVFMPPSYPGGLANYLAVEVWPMPRTEDVEKVASLTTRVKELEGERKLMAQLAKCQDEPQFTNPIVAMFAVNLRDKILSE